MLPIARFAAPEGAVKDTVLISLEEDVREN